VAALPDPAAVTSTSETIPASPQGYRLLGRALVVAAIDVVRPVVAFWLNRWWFLVLMAPALIAAKVFLLKAGVPWWLIAVVAVALFAAKTVLVIWHSRRAARRATLPIQQA
jgi:hypothetical protein